MNSKKLDEKFSERDLLEAVDDLATMKFFPHASKAAIMRQLAKMCPHKRALRWLVDQCVSHVAEWPGVAEVRGILCNKFDPADGVDAWSTLPGFSPADNEARYLEDHSHRKSLEASAPGIFARIGIKPPETVQ